MSQAPAPAPSDTESLRNEVAAIAARSRVGGLFYLAGWSLVVAASQGFVAHPLTCALIAAGFALLAALRFLLRPGLRDDIDALRRLRQLHWGILLLTSLLWGGGLTLVMIDPAFAATRPAAVVCSILFATAYAHSYPMSLPGTLTCLLLVYLPAPLWVAEAEGGRPVQIALAVYALYLLVTALRARSEYREHLVLQSVLRSQRDRFEQLSQHDGLTGLLNHAEFATRLARAGAQCRRGRDRCSLLLIDIDHFKQVNDRLGHAAGDALLVRFAAQLKQRFGGLADAAVARWGGEEFAVLLPGTTLEQAETQAGLFLEDLRQVPGSVQLPSIRASIGVGELVPGADPSTLLADVDRALYRAKAEGCDRVAVVAPAAAQSSASSA